MKARGGVEVLLYSFFNLGARLGGGQRHAPTALPPGKTREAGWAPRPVRTGAENLAFTGIRSPDRPVRSIAAIPTELPQPTYLY